MQHQDEAEAAEMTTEQNDGSPSKTPIQLKDIVFQTDPKNYGLQRLTFHTIPQVDPLEASQNITILPPETERCIEIAKTEIRCIKLYLSEQSGDIETAKQIIQLLEHAVTGPNLLSRIMAFSKIPADVQDARLRSALEKHYPALYDKFCVYRYIKYNLHNLVNEHFDDLIDKTINKQQDAQPKKGLFHKLLKPKNKFRFKLNLQLRLQEAQLLKQILNQFRVMTTTAQTAID